MATLSEKIQSALKSFEQQRNDKNVSAFVGFDGFIDEICEVVDVRHDFENYEPIETISEYAKRVASAAGKSTNLEFALKQIKMGGNGPLLSDALGRLGSKVTTVGAFGAAEIHPTFKTLEEHGKVVSVCDPAITIATEFQDGKIMHGKLETLKDITPQAVLNAFGDENTFQSELNQHQLIGIVNWTMIPHLSTVYRFLCNELKKMGTKKKVFFDLCDPAKRPKEDLKEALEIMSTFEDAGQHVILGLNEKESDEACQALGLDSGESSREGMLQRAERIRRSLNLSEVLIHPISFGVVASKSEGNGNIDGPICRNPVLTTGAGDHFNGGYCFGRLLGLSPQDSLAIGKATSGFYVRNGHGPSADDIVTFLNRWDSQTLDPWK